MTSTVPAQCKGCARYFPRTGACEAFPTGVPKEMVLYGGDHREPLAGDHGLQFVQGNDPQQVQAYHDWRAAFDVA